MNNMKDLFPGYYRPSEEDFAELWRNCIFAFDANVLLDLYRYKVETREDLLKILESITDRLWLPYQSAYEYQKNRLGVIQDQTKAYSTLRGTLAASQSKLKSELDKFRKHPFVDIADLTNRIEQAYDLLGQDVDRYEEEHIKKFPSMSLDGDEIRDRLDLLFDGKVGMPYDEAKLAIIYKEGKNRYEKSVPPGFLDKSKDENEYGDLVVWLQTLELAASQKKPVVFVTNDLKADWWHTVEGKTISPRQELIAELHQKTGQNGYIYSVSRFMEQARVYLAQDITTEAIEEVEMLQEVERQEIERLEVEHQQEAVQSLVATQKPAAAVVGRGWSSLSGGLPKFQLSPQVSEALKGHRLVDDTVAAALAQLRANQDTQVSEALGALQAWQKVELASATKSLLGASRITVPSLFPMPSVIPTLFTVPRTIPSPVTAPDVADKEVPSLDEEEAKD